MLSRGGGRRAASAAAVSKNVRPPFRQGKLRSVAADLRRTDIVRFLFLCHKHFYDNESLVRLGLLGKKAEVPTFAYPPPPHGPSVSRPENQFRFPRALIFSRNSVRRHRFRLSSGAFASSRTFSREIPPARNFLIFPFSISYFLPVYADDIIFRPLLS